MLTYIRNGFIYCILLLRKKIHRNPISQGQRQTLLSSEWLNERGGGYVSRLNCRANRPILQQAVERGQKGFIGLTVNNKGILVWLEECKLNARRLNKQDYLSFIRYTSCKL